MPDTTTVEVPHRFRLSRSRGWRMPPNSISVARPGPWGNLYRVKVTWTMETGQQFGVYGPDGTRVALHRSQIAADADAVDRYANGIHLGLPGFPTPESIRKHLCGRNLGCWCWMEDLAGNPWPCHGNVHLQIANT